MVSCLKAWRFDLNQRGPRDEPPSLQRGSGRAQVPRHRNRPLPYNHGYWLDRGEEDCILDLMKQRARDLRRSESAAQQWARFMERGGSGDGFLDRVKDLFN